MTDKPRDAAARALAAGPTCFPSGTTASAQALVKKRSADVTPQIAVDHLDSSAVGLITTNHFIFSWKSLVLPLCVHT
jgi:hypothetical protein